MYFLYKNEYRIFKLVETTSLVYKKGTKVERRKIEEMNQIGLSYIYTWKYHKEIPCVAILNKQKCHFFLLSFAKLENKMVEQVLPGG
jgi:RNase P subunit RPR2